MNERSEMSEGWSKQTALLASGIERRSHVAFSDRRVRGGSS